MRPSIRADAARSDDRLKHTEERQGRGSAAGHGRDGEVGGEGGGGAGGGGAKTRLHFTQSGSSLSSVHPAVESLSQQEALTAC